MNQKALQLRVYKVLSRLAEQVDSPEHFVVHEPADLIAYHMAVASGYVKGDVITLQGLQWCDKYKHPVRTWIREHWFTLSVACATMITSISGIIIEWMSQGFLGFLWRLLQ